MSRKVQNFASVITTPLNVHNFVVNIPDLGDEGLNLVVESTTFPTYKFRKITLWHQGEPIDYPALPESTREWTVTVPENDGGRMYSVIQKLNKEIYGEKTGLFVVPKYRDVQVFARDLNDQIVFSCVLHGTFFTGVSPINLSSTDPSQVWKWQLTFNFTWIENIDVQKPSASKSPYE